MNTHLTQGLSEAEAQRLYDAGFFNEPVENPSKSIGQIIVSNVFTYFNFIFLCLAALLIFVGSYRDLTFLPVIFSNTLIGIIQEIRSKKVLDRLTVLHAPEAFVIRDGKEKRLPVSMLVQGDLVHFRAGNQICADASLELGELSVNEALLTGEADEITKKPGSKLLSGSFVVSGDGYAVLTKVGRNSYISKLTLAAKSQTRRTHSEMILSLNRLVRMIGILLIPIGLGLFSMQHFSLHSSVKDSVISTVAALIGMIPEGLYLLASAALVLSVLRLANHHVLVHEMACIETLARVDVLCVDKTGTITENEMSVETIVPFPGISSRDFTNALKDFTANMSSDNQTMQALKQAFPSLQPKKASQTVPFSGKYKYSGASFKDVHYVLGAPEFVLLSDYPKYRSTIDDYSREGYRVLLFGTVSKPLTQGPLTSPAMPFGLVLLTNPIRKEAAKTFSYFSNQGVDIKVISGDNPLTVSKVAKKAGILHAEQYVDASTLHTAQEIEEAILSHTVFGRVTPEQKRLFIQALKEHKKTVAMTGDGVNDVLALKDADCSIAMASGSDAAKNTSQLVLLDSNFSHMPSVVWEGRRVVNNLERSASLFLIKNIFSMLMSVFSLIFFLEYPLVPSQMSLLGLCTIGTPASLLALQTNKNKIHGHFLTNVFKKALPAGLTDFLAVAILSLIGNHLSLEDRELSTIALSILLSVGFATLIKVCYPFDRYRTMVCLAMLILLIGCVKLVPWLFAVTLLHGRALNIQILFSLCSILLLGLFDWILNIFRYTHERNGLPFCS